MNEEKIWHASSTNTKKNIPLSTKVQGNITVTEKKENRRKTEGKLRKHSN